MANSKITDAKQVDVHKLLRIKPKRWKCPFCNDEFAWGFKKAIADFKESEYIAHLCYFSGKRAEIDMCYHSGFFSFETHNLWCSHIKNVYNPYSLEEVQVNLITFSRVIRLEIPIKVDFNENNTCDYCDIRYCPWNGGSVRKVKFMFYYDLNEYEELIDSEDSENDETSNPNNDNTENAVAATNQVAKTTKSSAQKEESTMKENILTTLPVNFDAIAENLGVEFGLNKDERIKSTILGTVVEYEDGKFRGYDRVKGTMTNYANLATTNLPILMIPATQVKKGDTIIHSGSPYFVEEPAEEESVWAVNALKSVKEQVVPIENPLGMKCYTRLISVGEFLGFNGSNPTNQKIVLWLLTMVAGKYFSDGVDVTNVKIQEFSKKAEEYTDLLLPFAVVAFAAWAIQGDDASLRISKIADTAKDRLGLNLDCLKDKRTLSKICAIGGIALTAGIHFKNKAKSEILEDATPEEVESLLSKLVSAVKPFSSSIQKILPAALAICAVKLFTGKEFSLEKIKNNLEGLVFVAEDFVCEKFHVSEDFFNKENLKKVAAVAVVAVVAFAIYGKKNGSGEGGEQTNLLKQLLTILGPVVPILVLAVPMLKEFFNKYGEDDFDDEFEYWEEETESSDSEQSANADFSEISPDEEINQDNPEDK